MLRDGCFGGSAQHGSIRMESRAETWAIPCAVRAVPSHQTSQLSAQRRQQSEVATGVSIGSDFLAIARDHPTFAGGKCFQIVVGSGS